ncbi:MAG: CRISPR system precrRNA processing endoribonuclease RAMP protein Cas6 [Bryobacterales bacterium]|nr:CRISPR system precrRNA processing endoribonuclease RAMP protein Cas6 [Bryobacterales bacterium]
MNFEIIAFRFHFEAVEPVYFGEGKAGNIVRGAFGIHFRDMARQLGQPELFDRIFQPALEEQAALTERLEGRAPSGLGDLPRPFVFRATHLDGRTIGRGQPFHFDLHLFDTRDAAVDVFAGAFARVAEAGLGANRSKATLRSAEHRSVVLNLLPRRGQIGAIRVRFATPTEMKSDGRLVSRPEFSVLIGRIRDRISTLRALYGPGPLALDFRAFSDRAATVAITRCAIERTPTARRSSRTGQVHPIGGFTGEVEYAGELSEFVPYLEAARWTGVGRHTVWGNGAIEVEPAV